MNKRTSESQLSDPLHKLLSMPLVERIAAVLVDVRTRKDEFRLIAPHKLAEALAVPEVKRPTTRHWRFIHYAWKQSLEEWAYVYGRLSELVHLIKNEVAPERLETLEEKSRSFENDCGDPQFAFFTAVERRLLEEAIALVELQNNMDNGICCVARHQIRAAGGDLSFEAHIEDDGTCVNLSTPYDQRDGGFPNLNDCVTDDLLWEKRASGRT